MLTSNPHTSHGGSEMTRKTNYNVFHPRTHLNRLVPQQRVLAVQLPEPPVPQQRVLTTLQPVAPNNTDSMPPRVTWYDQQQLPDPSLPLTDPAPQPIVPIPSPPWTAYDVSSVRGTAVVPLPNSPAFTNPTTSDHAANLAARIAELQTELQISRAYYNN
jgi:hypothetical protein